MAIKISGTTVIDDSRNFSTTGIMTVGSGSSTITLSQSSNFVVGVGVTLNTTVGNISIAGTITAGGLSLPLSLS